MGSRIRNAMGEICVDGTPYSISPRRIVLDSHSLSIRYQWRITMVIDHVVVHSCQASVWRNNTSVTIPP